LIKKGGYMGKKILLVDDDKDFIRGMAIRLKASGYDTVFATDGIMAITVAKNEMPDLIILDIGLPAGDGFIVMGRLKGLMSVAFTPVIVLSARDPAEWKVKSLDAGARAFFQKPADQKEILAVIQRILSENEVAVQEEEVGGAEIPASTESGTNPLGEMESHIFDAVLKFVAKSSDSPGPDLKAAESDGTGVTESAKENMAAESIRTFIAKKIKECPGTKGIPYSDLYEHFLYAISDRPKRPLADWILDYFYKTDLETYRLPSTPAEERTKAVGRARKASTVA